MGCNHSRLWEGVGMSNATAYGKDFAFLRNLAQEKVTRLCIYGCGVNGEVISKFLESCGKNIEFFVDKQAECREFTVLGRRVISPAAFFEKQQNIKIIVSPDNQEPVVSFLLENGIDEKRIICPFKKVEKNIRLLSEDYSPQDYLNTIDRHSELSEPDMPEVTVFTILYNTPGWMLCRAIESILDQSYKKLKYLIIDNGSTDASENIIRQYASADNRIQYIRLKQNVPWTNRELLLALKENIDTRYVAMLDSDDYYEKSFLQKAISILKRDDSDIVQVNTLTYAHDGFRYSYFAHYLGEDLCIQKSEKERYLMLRILNVPVWGKLYKGELFKNLIDKMLSCETEYERDRNFCLDISWMTYMALAGSRASMCDDILHIRTWRAGSSEHSDNYGSKWLSSMVWSFEHLCKRNVKYEDSIVYEEAALMWLFSLPRDEYSLPAFRSGDLENRAVKEFLKRPVCDRYRGSGNV